MTPKVTIVVLSAVCVVLALVAHTLLAFNLEGDRRWPPGKIALEMQLGASGSLIDGSADWDECGIAALVEWNENLGGAGVSFNAIRDSTRTPAANDGFSNVFFADDVFGTAFGERTLAFAAWWFIRREGIDEVVETDVVFNNAKGFNCYRGGASVINCW